MKLHAFISIFISMNIIFIFLHIHKHTQFIKQSFQKQKNEQLLAQLTQKKQELINQLYALKNNTAIKKFAQEQLHMKPVRLHQIKRLAYHDIQT